MMKSTQHLMTRVMVLALVMTAHLNAEKTTEERARIAKAINSLKQNLEKQIDVSQTATSDVKVFIKFLLLTQWNNPVWVREIEAQNRKNTPLEDIKKIDGEWVNAEDELPIHKAIMNNACAKEIKKIAGTIPAIGETFVMDHQGANVGQNALTSDYWQGDEAKWQKAFNDGKGGIEISEAKLDKSANIVDQKVSIPVINQNGEVIGAVCFGIDKNYADVIGRVLSQVDAVENASEHVKAYTKTQLIQLCLNTTIAKEIQIQNEKGIDLEDIKKVDQEWKDAEDELPIHQEKTSNACAQHVIAFIKNNPAVLEAFVMDNQGANVGQNALTSDYWQGDEAKWQNSYKDGQGGVDIGNVEFDKSANAQLQQISLPVFDSKGKVVGAVCFGIKTEAVKAFQIARDSSITISK